MSKKRTYIEQIDFYSSLDHDYPGAVLIQIEVYRHELDDAVALSKKRWPDAKVLGIVADHDLGEGKSLVRVELEEEKPRGIMNPDGTVERFYGEY